MNGSHAAPARSEGYRETYARWQADPDAYWLDMARAIDWIKPPVKAFDPTAGIYGRWFPDATCNTCFNALDRHVRDGRGEQVVPGGVDGEGGVTAQRDPHPDRHPDRDEPCPDPQDAATGGGAGLVHRLSLAPASRMRRVGADGVSGRELGDRARTHDEPERQRGDHAATDHDRCHGRG